MEIRRFLLECVMLAVLILSKNQYSSAENYFTRGIPLSPVSISQDDENISPVHRIWPFTKRNIILRDTFEDISQSDAQSQLNDLDDFAEDDSRPYDVYSGDMPTAFGNDEATYHAPPVVALIKNAPKLIKAGKQAAKFVAQHGKEIGNFILKQAKKLGSPVDKIPGELFGSNDDKRRFITYSGDMPTVVENDEMIYHTPAMEYVPALIQGGKFVVGHRKEIANLAAKGAKKVGNLLGKPGSESKDGSRRNYINYSRDMPNNDEMIYHSPAIVSALKYVPALIEGGKFVAAHGKDIENFVVNGAKKVGEFFSKHSDTPVANDESRRYFIYSRDMPIVLQNDMLEDPFNGKIGKVIKNIPAIIEAGQGAVQLAKGGKKIYDKFRAQDEISQIDLQNDDMPTFAEDDETLYHTLVLQNDMLEDPFNVPYGKIEKVIKAIPAIIKVGQGAVQVAKEGKKIYDKFRAHDEISQIVLQNDDNMPTFAEDDETLYHTPIDLQKFTNFINKISKVAGKAGAALVAEGKKLVDKLLADGVIVSQNDEDMLEAPISVPYQKIEKVVKKIPTILEAGQDTVKLVKDGKKIIDKLRHMDEIAQYDYPF